MALDDFVPSENGKIPVTLRLANHEQSDEYAVYQQFESRANAYRHQLLVFADAMAQLGSSAKLVSASCDLHNRLTAILELSRHHASALFPQEFHRAIHPVAQPELGPSDFPLLRKRLKLPHVTTPPDRGKIGLKDFPRALKHLANDLGQFSDCFDDFDEFSDETLKASIEAFKSDLQYWGSSMHDFEDQLALPIARDHEDHFALYDIARYLHGLSTEIGEHMESGRSALGVLVDVRVPTIRAMQDRKMARFTNLTTIATFFSAVTATTLQFSFANHKTTLETLVNAFWFTSLVFSVASAVNSLLSLTWVPTMYRSPESRVPWPLRVWITRTPLVFLGIAIASFSVGFALFTYSSGQVAGLCISIAVFTASSMLGMIALGAWFLLERLVFLRDGGRYWLAESRDLFTRVSLAATFDSFRSQFLPNITARAPVRHQAPSRRTGGSESFEMVAARSPNASTDAPARQFVAAEGDLPQYLRDHSRSGADLERGIAGSTFRRSSYSHSASTFPQERAPSPPSTAALSMPVDPVTLPLPEDPVRMRKVRLGILYIVKQQLRAKPPPDQKFTPLPIQHSWPVLGRSAKQLAHVRRVKPELQSLLVTETAELHTLHVSALAFSPDGKYLATVSSDNMGYIVKLSDWSSEIRPCLIHKSDTVSDILWSPKGDYLLTSGLDALSVWKAPEGILQFLHKPKRRIGVRGLSDQKSSTENLQPGAINHGATQQSEGEFPFSDLTPLYGVRWFPERENSDPEFLIIQKHAAQHMDIHKHILAEYSFERLRLRDIAISPNGEYLFAVAVLNSTEDGHEPVKARRQRRIVSYNRSSKKIEYQVPIFHDARYLTMSSDGKSALIAYDGTSPPELWHLGSGKQNDIAHMVHTYLPEKKTRFAGRCAFGGPSKGTHDLVLCTTRDGDTLIWDLASTTLLRVIRRVSDGDRTTCVAWNHSQEARDGYMLATGARDGTVKLWQSRRAPRLAPHIPPAPQAPVLAGAAEQPTSQGT